MKTPIFLTLLAGISLLPIHAQDDDTSSSGDSQGGHRPPPPRPSRLVFTLDADHDKVISAAEIANATPALTALDKNSDGQLTKDEFAGPRPRGKKDDKSRDDTDKSSNHRPPPPDPLAGAIDADHDHVISAAELANASAALITLDANGDGQLTRDEFAPPPPKRQHHGPSKSADGDDDDDSQPQPNHQNPGDQQPQD